MGNLNKRKMNMKNDQKYAHKLCKCDDCHSMDSHDECQYMPNFWITPIVLQPLANMIGLKIEGEKINQ